MRRIGLIAAAALLALAIAGAPTSAGSGATKSAPVKVSMGDNFFDPVTVKVPVRGKVVWTNDGKIRHNVAFGGALLGGGDVQPGGTVSRKFKRAGKFPYVCTLHAGMKGTVKAVAPKK
jgi:plastocyanin